MMILAEMTGDPVCYSLLAALVTLCAILVRNGWVLEALAKGAARTLAISLGEIESLRCKHPGQSGAAQPEAKPKQPDQAANK